MQPEIDGNDGDESDRSIILPGGGPDCPECSGPTFQVTDDLERYQRPWWCPDCNLRVTNEGAV